MKRYKEIPVLETENKTKYKGTSFYPEIPLREDDIYIETKAGDRYDILAEEFYGDTSLWWIIPSANPTLPSSTWNPPPGFQLRIPIRISTIISEYLTTNTRR